MTSRVLLVRVHLDRPGVEVENHPPGCAPASQRARAVALAARIPASSRSPIESTTRRVVETEATSPDSDDLTSERSKILNTPPAIGEHHRQIAEHPPRLMSAPAPP